MASIASDMDQQERELLEGDQVRIDGREGSENVNDSGYFSVQVLHRALSAFALQLVPLGRERRHVQDEVAFIANQQEHWFTIRRFR